LVREYRLGITLAHQQMTGVQFNDNIRNSISTNTAIKYASALGAEDLRDAAKELHCDPQFITSKMVEEHRVHFACYIRNHPIKRAFHVSFPKKGIENHPVMDEAAYQKLIEKNKATVSTRKPEQIW
jgi:hypothetical protein